MRRFLRDGKEFEPKFAQIPLILPVDSDLEKYWKLLYVSRKLHGIGDIIQFAKERNLEMDCRMFQDNQDNGGNYLGTELHGYSTDSWYAEDEPFSDVSVSLEPPLPWLMH